MLLLKICTVLCECDSSQAADFYKTHGASDRETRKCHITTWLKRQRKVFSLFIHVLFFTYHKKLCHFSCVNCKKNYDYVLVLSTFDLILIEYDLKIIEWYCICDRRNLI